MTHIYEEPKPRVLRHRVNGKDGFVVLPASEDDDHIYFEEWDTLIGWVEALAGQIVTTTPEAVDSFDEWLELHDGDDDV